jgi:hypothetical protein
MRNHGFRLAVPVVALAASVSILIVTTATAAAASGPVTFTDPTGDSGTAADITSVVVNNDAGGQITFQVNFGGPLASTHAAAVFIDADQNSGTGDPNVAGAEYAIWDDESTNGYAFQKWSGSAWAEASPEATVRVTGGGGTNQLTLSVNRSEIGGGPGFNFWVDSMDGNGGAGHEDQAPDSSVWNYQLQAAAPGALRLSVVYSLSPRTAKAGGVYTAGLLVQRSDTNGFLGSEGTLSCNATVGGKTLSSTGAFVTTTYRGMTASVPICAWQVPAQARGKKLVGSMTVTYQGAQVSRKFSATVR